MKDILTVIVNERMKWGWTEYRLAERSGIPQSTISGWHCRNLIPSITLLEKSARRLKLQCRSFSLSARATP